MIDFSSERKLIEEAEQQAHQLPLGPEHAAVVRGRGRGRGRGGRAKLNDKNWWIEKKKKKDAEKNKTKYVNLIR